MPEGHEELLNLETAGGSTISHAPKNASAGKPPHPLFLIAVRIFGRSFAAEAFDGGPLRDPALRVSLGTGKGARVSGPMQRLSGVARAARLSRVLHCAISVGCAGHTCRVLGSCRQSPLLSLSMCKFSAAALSVGLVRRQSPLLAEHVQCVSHRCSR